MFCPICKSEYREGFRRCAECNVRLVKELPPDDAPEFIDYTEVLSTFNPADIAILKSILNSTDIDYFFQGEHFGYLRPLALPTRLMVRKDQSENARKILRDLKLSFSGINLLKNKEKR